MLKIIAADPEAEANNYYFDGVNYHLYYKPRQLRDIIGEARALLDSYGLTETEIWLNETNAPPSSDPTEPPHREPRFKATLEEQSAFIIQGHAVAFAAGAERVQLYKLFNSTEHPEDVQPFGLLRGDKSRRPAFDAYRLVTEYFGGFEEVSLFEQGDVFVVVFDRPSDTVTVAWNMSPEPRQLTLNAVRDEATVLDETGRTWSIEADRRRYVLDLPPAACSSGECFIGGSPRILVEAGAAIDRAPGWVRPTPTPAPPTPMEIMVVSPRRRFLFLFLIAMGVTTGLLIIWQIGVRRMLGR